MHVWGDLSWAVNSRGSALSTHPIAVTAKPQVNKALSFSRDTGNKWNQVTAAVPAGSGERSASMSSEGHKPVKRKHPSGKSVCHNFWKAVKMFLTCIPLLLCIHSCNSTSGNTVYRNNAQCLQKQSCLLSGIYECHLGGWQMKNNVNIPLLRLHYYASSSSLLNWVDGGGIYIIV